MAVARTFLYATPLKAVLMVFLAHLPSFRTPSKLILKKNFFTPPY